MTDEQESDPRNEAGAAPSATSNRQLVYDKPDADLVKTLRAWYKEDADARGEARKRQESDWKMFAGDQWEQEARDAARQQQRPLLTLNYILPTIAAVEGEERSNRQEIKVYGRATGGEDDPGAFAFNQLIRWVMNECNGEYALSTCFAGAAICGEGWVLPEVDYFSDPEGQITLRNIDEKEITLDAASVSPDASDARRLTRERWLKDDEMEGMFPDCLAKIDRACAESGTPWRESDGSGYRDIYSEPGKTTTKVFDAKKREWKVLEHWWFEIAPGYAALDPATDSIVELTLEEGDALTKQYRQQAKMHSMATMTGQIPFDAPAPEAPQMVKRPIRRYFQAFTCHDVLLEKNPHPVPEARRFPYVPTFCYFDKIQKEFFGLVRSIKDVQRQHNVEQSSIVHMMQLMPKMGWKAPRGSYHDKERWINSASQPGVTLEYNAQKGEPKPIETATIPRHMIEMAMSRMGTMRDISGVNTEMTGQRVGGDAGVVMEMRKNAAMTVLARLFDNYRLTKKVVGKLLISYIQKYVPVGRRVLVLGQSGQPSYVEFTQDMQFARYHAIIDETSATPNDRMQTITMLQTVLPTIIDAGIPVPPSLIDLFPLPPHVKEEWKAFIAMQQQPVAGPPVDQAPIPVSTQQ